MKIKKNHIYLALIILLAFNFLLWKQIFIVNNQETAIYFLDVGQGDSQLVIIPPTSRQGGPIKILIDGGRGRKVLDELDKVMRGFSDKYIDLVILTHSDSDHFGGLAGVLKRYQVGAFIFNGRERELKTFQDLIRSLEQSKTQTIVLLAGDKIRYLNNRFSVLAPTQKNLTNNKKNNEAGLVLLMEINNTKTLFASDIGFKTENWLLQNYSNLTADILKVAHHGSKYSSGTNFINKLSPRVSIINVGKNSYGHPTERVLDVLANVGSAVYRTDLDGTIKLILDE